MRKTSFGRKGSPKHSRLQVRPAAPHNRTPWSPDLLWSAAGPDKSQRVSSPAAPSRPWNLSRPTLQSWFRAIT